MTSVNQAEEFGLNNKGALAVGKRCRLCCDE